MNIILCVAIIVSYSYLNLILIRRSHYDNLFVVETEEQKEEKMDALRKKLKKTPKEPKGGENETKEEEMSDDGKKESKL